MLNRSSTSLIAVSNQESHADAVNLANTVSAGALRELAKGRADLIMALSAVEEEVANATPCRATGRWGLNGAMAAGLEGYRAKAMSLRQQIASLDDLLKVLLTTETTSVQRSESK